MERIKDKLDKRAKFFCPAKWEELYLYLNHGLSNSCHHPIPHQISLDEVKQNPAALHNTSHKLAVQKQMLNGEIPSECHMCSHLEKENIVSDRFHKSIEWESSIETLQVDENHIPKLIEIVFDNLCNLSCSYCDSGQSSSWANILSKTGPWDIQTDNRNLYNKIHIKPGSTKPEFQEAWNTWWNQIKYNVKHLKISGGEPLMSPNFWQTLENVTNDKLDLDILLNSNMSVDSKFIKKLLTYHDKVNRIVISASIDGVGPMAEFTRNGLDYDLFMRNIDYWCENSPENCGLHLQSTVNVFSIWSLTDFFDLNIKLKEKYGTKIKKVYSTIVRFPEFQNISILPKSIKDELHEQMQNWYERKKSYLTVEEQMMVSKSINYIVSDIEFTKNLDHEILRKDLQKFLINYQKFSKHSFNEIYPAQFVKWLEQP